MFTPESLSILFGLSSAIAWGAGDFSGGFATRKNHVLSVIFFSQIVGCLMLLSIKPFFPESPPRLPYLFWGGSAGFCGACGMVALYKGLATGRMGIVAPVSAIATALIPMVFAFVAEGLPKTSQLLGCFVALIAVWFFSFAKGAGRVQKSEWLLSVLAGLGFGLFFICIDRVSEEAVLWPLIFARIVSISIIAAILMTRKQLKLPPGDQLACIALTGILDTLGNAFFALATQMGRLDISAILTSMYPASTVLLARLVLKERIAVQQQIGMAAACIALGLIAS